MSLSHAPAPLFSASADFVVQDSNGHSYVLNFCGPLAAPAAVPACGANNATQACQTWDGGASGIVVAQNDQLLAADRTAFGELALPALTVRLGGGVERFGVQAQAVVHFVCNGTQADVAPAFLKEEVAFFAYHFVLYRPEVCAGPAPTTTTAPPTTLPPPTSSTASTASTASAATSGNSSSTTGATTGAGGSSVVPTGTVANSTAGNGTTVAQMEPSGPNQNLIIVLGALGAIVVLAFTVLVCVYLARRRKRLSGYSALLQNPEKFARI